MLEEKHNIAVDLQGVSKAYPDSWLARRSGSIFSVFNRQSIEPFTVLNNVTIAIQHGEKFGIIGKNGAGKSTLLQIIAGTIRPSKGTLKVNGNIGALLELGSGFHSDFTGMENIRLSSQIAGIPATQLDAAIEAIVDFSELQTCIHKPVRTYSSGMIVRLAFAIQTQFNPNILIIDEALAVGDIFFQAKCIERIQQMCKSGTTLIFVSHSIEAVKSICDRATYLADGKIKAIGNVDEVCDSYFGEYAHIRSELSIPQTNHRAPSDNRLSSIAHYRSTIQPPFENRITSRIGTGFAQYIESCVFQENKEVDCIVHGSQVSVMAWIQATQAIPKGSEYGILVRTLHGIDLFSVNNYFTGTPIEAISAGNQLVIQFEFLALLGPGSYTVTLGLRVPAQGPYWDKVFNATAFTVVNNPDAQVFTLFRNPHTAVNYETSSLRPTNSE